MAFIDADEFWTPQSFDDPQSALRENLQIPDSAGIVLNWRIFGSSGHTTKKKGLVVERFTKAAPDNHKFNRHIKTIARVDRIARMNIHHAVPKLGYRFHNDRGVAQKFENDSTHGPITSGEVFSEQRINHYVIKSKEEFVKKKQSRGYAGGKTEEKRPGSFFVLHDINDETFAFPDWFILKSKSILSDLRARIGDD